MVQSRSDFLECQSHEFKPWFSCILHGLLTAHELRYLARKTKLLHKVCIFKILLSIWLCFGASLEMTGATRDVLTFIREAKWWQGLILEPRVCQTCAPESPRSYLPRSCSVIFTSFLFNIIVESICNLCELEVKHLKNLLTLPVGLQIKLDRGKK